MQFSHYGCSKNNSTTVASKFAGGGSQQKKEAASGADTETKCALPAALSDTASSKLSSLQEIKSSLTGQYVLDEVHVYQVGTLPDGKANGAFYAKATRYIGQDKAVQTNLDFICTDFDKDASVAFFSGITVPVAALAYFPSGRITAADAGGSYDDSSFNAPLIADVHFNSIGQASYTNFAKGKVVGPPYVSNLYFDNLSAMWPASTKFYIRSSGGFEVRFSQSENVDLGKGQTFTTTSSVLITYKKSVD